MVTVNLVNWKDLNSLMWNYPLLVGSFIKLVTHNESNKTFIITKGEAFDFPKILNV